MTTAFHITMALGGLSVMWVLTRLALGGVNLLVRLMPRLGGKNPPWLRRKGILLLPPRYRARKASAGTSETAVSEINDEILEIHERYRKGAISAWQKAWPWIRRAIGIAITVWIFAIMIRPLREHWTDVREQIHD